MFGDSIITNAEEPLSLLSNDDPGYETVRPAPNTHHHHHHLKVTPQSERKISLTETSSEHDPNYETLLPNATLAPQRFREDEEDDGYSMIKAKPMPPPPPPTGVILQKATTTSSCTDNEGYSSIRNVPAAAAAAEDEEEEPGGYSKIGSAAAKKAVVVHGYASIDEAKKDHLEGYSTIAPPPLPVAMVASTTSVTSTTTSSVSPVSPINYFPAPSADTSSYSSNTSPSSEFSSSDVNLNRLSGNNYESLTSEDPNYETVRHLRITENPYEVLENDVGGTPVTATATVPDATTTAEESGKISPSDSPEVGDYFQV